MHFLPHTIGRSQTILPTPVKKDAFLKKTIKTNTSNLHANDIGGAISSFYAYLSSWEVVEIGADLDQVSAEIVDLLREVHL